MLRTVSKIGLVAVVMTLASLSMSRDASAAHPHFSNGHNHGHNHNSGYHSNYNSNRSGFQITVNRPFFGGFGSFGYSSGPQYAPQYHDTTHLDYVPGGYARHRGHYDYIPGHTVVHQSGHYHH